MLSASLIGYADSRVFDSDGFAGLVGDTMSRAEVRDFLADAINEEILRLAPDAAAGGTIIRDLTASVLDTDAARALVETAARELHSAVFEENSDSALLTVSDLIVTIRGQLQLLAPDIADLIPAELNEAAIDIGSQQAFTDLIQLADDVEQLALITGLLALGCLLAAVLVDRQRWRGAGKSGLALAVTGGLLFAAIATGGVVLGSYTADPATRDAVSAVWDVFISDLALWAVILIAVGGVTCAFAWSLLRVEHLTTPVGRVRAWITTPPTSLTGQITRAVATLTLGVWLILQPLSLLSVLGVFAGILLAITALNELLRITGLDKRIASAQTRAADAGAQRPSGRPSGRQAAVIAAAIVLGLAALAVAGAVVLRRSDRVPDAPVDLACNGHVELCGRRLDEVALAATHNSMSSATDGFYLANHTKGMIDQLDSGFRGLLIDTWYGQRSESGAVVTSGTVIDPASLDDDSAAAAAERVRQRLTGSLGPTEVYLCHGFCEIGAVDALTALTEVRAWLDEHPREVLVIFVQDATSPADTAAVFEASGLSELAWTHVWGTLLPTLEQMITANKRIFVMAENDAGDPEGELAWYHEGFRYTQETPFSFSSVADFSCAPNRGLSDSPLFQVNHFITPALGRNGSINDLEVLLPRLEQCQAERSRIPNLVAVDFYEAGDVIAAIDAVNGVGSE